MKRRKIIFLGFLSILGCSLICSPKSVKAEVSDGDIERTYYAGIDKKIIKSADLSLKEYRNLCKESVIPSYEEEKRINSSITFDKFMEQDNYESAVTTESTVPVDMTSQDKSSQFSIFNFRPYVNLISNNSYKMKAGDILICYGNNSSGRFVGHAAIATSSSYILEMPGTKISRYATHTSKSTFFKRYTSGSSFVRVYRLKDHPIIADHASTWAYNNMYRKNNPTYGIDTNLFRRSPSYCSKYVFLAYHNWAPSSVSHPSFGIIPPHNLVDNFTWNYRPAYIGKVTS